MSIKLIKDDRSMVRINGKIKALFTKNKISAQGIVDDFIRKNVVFVVDPKTQEVIPEAKKSKAVKEPLKKHKKA